MHGSESFTLSPSGLGEHFRDIAHARRSLSPWQTGQQLYLTRLLSDGLITEAPYWVREHRGESIGFQRS